MTVSMTDQLLTVTLYEKLGGIAGIRRLVDAIVDAHLRNPIIRARYLPYLNRQERLAEFKEQTCLFVSARCGSPDASRDAEMIATLRRMSISNAEYMAGVDDIMATMTKCGYDEGTRSEVRTALYFLKADIVAA